ncbi:hypothetical protein GW846_04565 [Candidatus Gracilibacteria bacterium]|nr:hypothetical protein [Candidatus Gracilibacteria bacterium]
MAQFDTPDFCEEAKDGGFTNDLTPEEKDECGIKLTPSEKEEFIARRQMLLKELDNSRSLELDEGDFDPILEGSPDSRTSKDLFPGDFDQNLTPQDSIDDNFLKNTFNSNNSLIKPETKDEIEDILQGLEY